MARRSQVITRRDFVKAGGGLAAAGLLGAAGAGSVAAADPARVPGPPVLGVEQDRFAVRTDPCRQP